MRVYEQCCCLRFECDYSSFFSSSDFVPAQQLKQGSMLVFSKVSEAVEELIHEDNTEILAMLQHGPMSISIAASGHAFAGCSASIC